MKVKQMIEETGSLVIKPKEGTVAEFLYLQKLLKANPYFMDLDSPAERGNFVSQLRSYNHYRLEFGATPSHLTYRVNESDPVFRVDEIANTAWLADL